MLPALWASGDGGWGDEGSGEGRSRRGVGRTRGAGGRGLRLSFLSVPLTLFACMSVCPCPSGCSIFEALGGTGAGQAQPN